jgi:hypothetical protein
MTRYLFVLTVTGLIIAGCASDQQQAYVRDGVQYGVTDTAFRGRWWSYYERGASFLQGEFYQEAATDFQKALQGRSRDAWRARTYGLHFVEYFPNRELGVALFHLGQLEEAESALQTSLSQIDTERAHYYLDQVTKAKIAQGIVNDTTDPSISADVGLGNLVSERQVPLRIVAQDDTGVETMRVNGALLPQRGAGAEVAYEDDFLFTEGAHSVEIVASDLADKQTAKTQEIVVDLTGPTIGLNQPLAAAVTQAASIAIDGVAVDKHGVAEVLLGDQQIAAGGGERLPFTADQPLQPGENVFVITARDQAGNETRTAVSIYQGNPQGAAAQLWLLEKQSPEKLKTASALPGLLGITFAAVEDETPGIHLKSPQSDPDRPYRHNKSLRISGEVITTTQVASLTINGEPVGERTGTPRESFQKRIPIDGEPETVTVNVQAADAAGATYSEDIVVNVQPVRLQDKRYKLPIAVLPFQSEGIDPNVLNAVWNAINGIILNSDRFRAVERAQIESVLQELQLTELADPAQALQIGQLTQAYVLLAANIIVRDAKEVEVHARLIDTTTSEQMATYDVFIKDVANPDDLNAGAQGLLKFLKEFFPELSGEVTFTREVRGRPEIGVNWTTEDNVPAMAPLWVVYEIPAELDPDTGEELYPADYEPVGRGRIIGVRDTGSRAEVVEREDETIPLEVGMPTVTM